MLPKLRRGRAAAGLMLALFSTLLPFATAYALSVSVTPAAGGSTISADDFGTSNWTTLTGPALTENGAGILAAGDVIALVLPSGFKFNTAVGTLSISGAGCDLTTTAGAVVATGSVSVKILHPSTVSTCVLTFVGLQVQPTSGNPTSGNITNVGSANIPTPGNYGTLAEVAGKVAQVVFTTQPSASTTGGIAFATQPVVTAIDQFTNFVANAPVQLSITPGSGTAGAVLTCTTNPVNTNAVGRAIYAGCRIDKAGTYTVRATSNGKTADSGTFVITVGPANKLVFTSYPNATTPALLSPQPTVAITDAGGNVITTATNMVTLAINQNPGTFSCSGGLSTAAVAGIATFSGCTQSTIASGYQLTATSTTPVPTVTGPAFAVSPPVLAFITGPGNPLAAQPFNVQVAIQNGGVTLASGISATVTLTLGANPGGGTLTCSGGNSVGTINGVATFTGCSINNAGTGYTLIATATNVLPPTAIGPATSAAFNVGTAISPAVISIATFCGSPDPISSSGPNSCVPDTSRTPPQTNIKLPQTTSEGVYLVAQFASNGGNRSVVFEVSKDQVTWSTIATVNSDASGAARTFYRPSDNRYYRAQFAGAVDLGPGTSGTVRVVVRSLIFIRPTSCTASNPCRKSRNQTVTFTATARPNRIELPTQHVQFVVQRASGGTYVTVVTQVRTVSKSTGTATLDLKFTSAGTYRLRANLLPTTVNANSFPTDFEYYRIS